MGHIRLLCRASLLGALGCLLAVAAARPARACGGFFCDRPNNTTTGNLPIAQSAENVFFLLDTDPQSGQRRVEAHIQIVYTGSADQFSWVVPVTATPTLDVGTDVLFDRLDAATRPTYTLTFQNTGVCQGQSSGGGGGGCLPGASNASASGPALNGSGPTKVMMPPVNVLFRGAVGPYDSAIVQSDDPQALRTWLVNNGYFVSNDAARIIDEYVAAHSAFVALRLRQGLDTSAIRPIILRLPADEACLPLKLTAIAAVPDLRINVWVLGDGRAVPINYTEIALNAARVDWFGGAKNYDQVLGQAADEAGGNAFAVEYAQSAASLGAALQVPPSQTLALRQATTPPRFVTTLAMIGFPVRGDVLDVLRRHLPLPPALAAQGVSETNYYQSLSTYWPQVIAADPTAGATFDPVATADDLEQTVFAPLRTVAAPFTGERKLTRLATFISPEEMTKDPLFVTNRDLPDVSPVYKLTGTVLCDGDHDVCHAPIDLSINGSVDVVYAVPPSAIPPNCNPGMLPYERGDIEQLPASTTGYTRAADGADALTMDNRPAIAEALGRHNLAARAVGRGASEGCALPGHARPAMPLITALVWLTLRARRRRAD